MSYRLQSVKPITLAKWLGFWKFLFPQRTNCVRVFLRYAAPKFNEQHQASEEICTLRWFWNWTGYIT